MIIDYFGSTWQQHSMQHSSWGWRQSLQLTGFRQWNICPSLIRVSHTGSPLVLHFTHQLYSTGHRYLQRHGAAVRGGFPPESPNQLLGLQISVSFRNSGIILTSSFILRYPVTISSIWAHPKELSAFPDHQGREQLPQRTKTFSYLEGSELQYNPGNLSGTARLSAPQIGGSIGHLLPWGRHLFLWLGVLLLEHSPETTEISSSPIQISVLANFICSSSASYQW